MKTVPFTAGLNSYNAVKLFSESCEFDNAVETLMCSFKDGELYSILLDIQDTFKAEYGLNCVYMVYLEDKFPVAIYGATPIMNGNVETFSYTDISVSPYKFAKVMIEYVKYLNSIDNIKRIQATVLSSNEKARSMHEKLGFACEGKMKKYDGTNDYYMYARVK